jgi:hypothetical protein
MKRALERIERGEPPFKPSPDDDQAAILRDYHAWQERLRQVFDEVAYGAFLADFWAARNQTLSDDVRAAAIGRLIPSLRPDKTERDNRLYPAAERRWRMEGLDGTASELLEREVVTAIYEAIAMARAPRDDVYLPLTGKNEKYTHARDGQPIVPAHDLRDVDLHHALKAVVRRIVDREFQSEIEDLKQIKAASGAPWAVEASGDDPQQFQARQVVLANLWAWGNAQARDVLGANGGERTPRTMSGARRPQPETPLGVRQVGKGASVCLFCGQPQSKHGVAIGPLREPQEFRHGFVLADKTRAAVCTCSGSNPTCATTKATPNGQVGDTDGHIFSVEALHGVGTKGLDALEAERVVRPQRTAKVEEIKQLATPEQRRLIEAIFHCRPADPETGYASHVDLAKYLGKRETAVRKLMFDLLAKVSTAAIEPPQWTRPPLPPREIYGGTIPAHVYSTDRVQRGVGFGFVADVTPPWPCTLPTRGFASSSTAEGFLKPRNGVPA